MKVVKEQILSSHHKENYCLFCFFNAVSIWDERWLPDLLWSSLHDISLCCPPWTYTVPPVNYISIKLEGKHFWSIRLLPETMPLLTKKCLLEENNRCIQHADTSRETLLVCGLPSWPQAGANGVVKEGRSSKLDKLRACEEDWVKSSKKACSLYVWGFSGTPSRFVLSSLTVVSWQILFLFFFFWLFRMVCRNLLPRPGIEPRPSAVRALSPNNWTARELPLPATWNQLLFWKKAFIFLLKAYWDNSSENHTYYSLSSSSWIHLSSHGTLKVSLYDHYCPCPKSSIFTVENSEVQRG